MPGGIGGDGSGGPGGGGVDGGTPGGPGWGLILHETFPNLDAYSAIPSGAGSHFLLGADSLQCLAFNGAGDVPQELRRYITRCVPTRLRFEFKITSSVNLDDAAVIVLRDGTTPHSNFIPRREDFYDAARHAAGGIGSTLDHHLGASPLPAGTWMRGIIDYVAGPGNCTIEVVNLDDNSVLISGSLSGDSTSTPIADHIAFALDSGGVTVPAEYRAVYLWGTPV